MKHPFIILALLWLASICLCTQGIAGEDTVFSNVSATSQDNMADEPATQKKSLTRMLREYQPEDVLTEPETDENVLDVEVPEQGIRFDEKDTLKNKAGAGYQKTKEDFVDPKSVMTK